MKRLRLFVRRAALAAIASATLFSYSTSAVSTSGTTYNYRSMNDVLWYEPGCKVMSKPTAAAPSVPADKAAKVLIPLFDSSKKTEAMAAIDKYKFGGMAMTGDGRAFDRAFFSEAKTKAGEPFVPMADEEGGGVARYKVATKPASELGKMSVEDVQKEGKRVAEGLKNYGIEVDLAPVLDIEKQGISNHLQAGMNGASRAFGFDAKTVTEKAGAFAQGLSAGGVTPVYKHFPGLGQATAHTDFSPATLDYTKLGEDLKPFKALAGQNSGMVMLSNAKIVGLGGSDGEPAPTNKRLIEKLRGEIGFSGTIITDDLDAVSKWSGTDLPTTIANSLNAGADLALFKYPGDETMDKIMQKLKADVPTERTDEAYDKTQASSAADPAADTTQQTAVVSSTPSSGGGDSCACSTGIGSIQLSGKDNIEKILNFFMSKGLTLAQAAGIAGNMQAESGLNPAIEQGGRIVDDSYTPRNGVGFGLVQWTFTSRQQPLVNHMKEMGVGITDLGGQLEFVWKELNSPTYIQTLNKLKTVQDPVDAAIVVHGNTKETRGNARFEALNLSGPGYEASGDSADTVIKNRGGAAQKFYDDASKSTGAQALSSSGGSGGCGSSGGGVMSADCATLVTKFKELRGTKFTDEQPAMSDKDLANCTTDEIKTGSTQIQSGCKGTGIGGVNPKLLRAILSAIDNSGDEKAVVGNMNSGHFCDALNHPAGKASDLMCNIPSNTNRGAYPSADKCTRIFKYLYDHYDELGLVELIWNEDLPFSKMGDGKHTSYVAGHDDHIHVGVKG